VLTVIENRYASSRLMPRVQVLQRTLALPEENTPDEIVSDSTATETVPADSVDGVTMLCSDLYPDLAVRGGIEQFEQAIEYPNWATRTTLQGELVYTLTIAPDGEVTDYEQASRMDRSGIPQVFEQTIEDQLMFEPTNEDGVIQCNYTFRYQTR